LSRKGKAYVPSSETLKLYNLRDLGNGQGNVEGTE